MTLLIVDVADTMRRLDEARSGLACEERVDDILAATVACCKRALQTQRPNYATAVFDAAHQSWRQALDEQYLGRKKALAPLLQSQLPGLQQALSAMGLHWFCAANLDAVDVMATLVEKWCHGRSDGVVIWSGNKLCLQWLSDQVRIFDGIQGVWRNQAYVQQKFGIKPEQIADLLALMGDAGNGIAGVPRIGAKTAAALLRINGHLERVLSNADKLGGQVGANLRQAIDVVRLGKKLSACRTDVALGLSWKMLARQPGPDASA